MTLGWVRAAPQERTSRDMPGIGQLAWKAALARDLELLVMLTMIVTTVTLLANSTAAMLGKAAVSR